MLPAGVRAEEIHVEPISLGDLHGVLISVRGHALFAIADADLDASTNETLESVSAWSVAQLQSVLQARAEQRRPAVVLRALDHLSRRDVPAFESQPARSVVVPRSSWFAAPAVPPKAAQGDSSRS